ncbi:MAG: chloramphenicol acetyltransferase, partial [Pseudomonadota bacterium]
MTRLSADTPVIHPDCTITDVTFGAYVEIGRGSRVANT